MSTAFAAAAGLPCGPLRPPAVCRRAAPTASKKGSGKKRGKNTRPKPATPRRSKPIEAAASPPASESAYPGPIAPELLEDAADAVSTPPEMPAPFADDVVDVGSLDDDAGPPMPVADEARLKLPDLGPAGAKGAKRKRKPRAQTRTGEGDATVVNDTKVEEPTGASEERLSSQKIRELTAAYRSGGEGAEVLIEEIEKNPDYMFQTGNPEGEYDLASAIIGTGSPNKQGIYLLPYLQSGHLLLLLIVALCAFVYYPGFPLTELDDSLRTLLKRGLALTYLLNLVLAVLAFRDAEKRGQPAAFWALKTALLGNLAFNELRRNAPIQKRE